MTADPAKVAFVTRADHANGRAIALALAGHGWNVVVHSESSSNAILATVRDITVLGQRAAAITCPLADEAAVKDFLPRAARAIGASRIDCLINDAIPMKINRADDFSLAQLDASMHANLGAPVLLAHALYAMTPDSERAVVINLLNQKALCSDPDFFIDNLVGSALQTATTLLARKLAPKLRIVGITTDSAPEDIAASVCFAVENQAITGSVLQVDGGKHLLPPRHDAMFNAN